MENLTSPAPIAATPAASPDQATPPGENSFAEILSEFEQQHHGPARGQATQGTVVSITPDSVFVDIGRATLIGSGSGGPQGLLAPPFLTPARSPNLGSSICPPARG